MRPRDETEIGGERAGFPSTHWSELGAVRRTVTREHRAVLNLLIERYWKPVYTYIRRRGQPNEESKDLAQEFFTSWLQKDLFGRAVPARGRFRTFLLSCLRNFLANANRKACAQKRLPRQGFVSIRDISDRDTPGFEPIERETPEMAFNKVWVLDLLRRVLNAFAQECRGSGKEIHAKIFNARIVRPALEGAAPPSMRALGRRFGLTQKEVANRLVTARRAFRRLLRDEVRGYASSEQDVEAEIQDLFQTLAKP